MCSHCFNPKNWTRHTRPEKIGCKEANSSAKSDVQFVQCRIVIPYGSLSSTNEKQFAQMAVISAAFVKPNHGFHVPSPFLLSALRVDGRTSLSSDIRSYLLGSLFWVPESS